MAILTYLQEKVEHIVASLKMQIEMEQENNLINE
jgi:hypothetical protein